MFKTLKIVWALLAGRRKLYFAALLCLGVSHLFNYLAPLIGSVTLDFVLSGKIPEPGTLLGWTHRLMALAGPLKDNLWYVVIGMAGLTAFGGIFAYYKGRLVSLASDGIARDLRDRLYDHVQRLPARYIDTHETGDMVQRCTSDVDTTQQFLSNQVVEIGNAVLLLGIALPLMYLIDTRMTLVSLCLILPITLFAFFYFRSIKAVFKSVDEAEGALTTVIQENLTGIRVVRAFARQEHEEKKFATRNSRYRDNQYHQLRMMAWYWSISDFASLLQLGIALFAGAYWVAGGTLTVGQLFAFMAYLGTLLWPVRHMGRVLTDLGKASVSLTRIREILDTPEETPREAPGARPEQRLAGGIQISGLRFSHGGERHALNGVGFEVRPGESLAILGPAGSGKSTLMHLLLRLYDYSEGSIRLDGHELSTLDRQWVRSQLGVVMQEPFLFSKTLRENIRLGRAEAQNEEIEAAADAAAIHSTITGFKEGYDTLIGERGITLSGGQRQRVAIARAILRNPAILILDDALSAVDSETESLILDALKKRRGQRTTLVIAHRLTTVMHADRMIVLDKGHIIQQGTHAELSQQEGLYRRLWNIQTSLEEEFAAEVLTNLAPTN
ncbi:MAG: ABC transporter ATP-binding protein [Verrucomicrobiota bacterium]|nr:ABC transporter ATP-binding protein [Verrucomicrobiota bacterium]